MLSFTIRRRRLAGVTLIEIAITLAIVAISIVLGLPGITEWIQSSQVRTTAEAIKNGMQKARAEAVRGNMPTEFILTSPGTIGGTGWSVRVVRTNTTVESKPNGEGSANALITPTPGNATTVTFTGLGRRKGDNADASPVLTQADITGASGARPLRVTVAPGGEVRMCDPDTGLASGDPRKC